MSADAPLRQPIPLARSILWNPATAGARGGRPGGIPFPIFVAQSAVAAIHEHLATAPPHPGQGLLGFLVGWLADPVITRVPLRQPGLLAPPLQREGDGALEQGWTAGPQRGRNR